MVGGAWRATVHRVTKSRTRPSNFTFNFILLTLVSNWGVSSSHILLLCSFFSCFCCCRSYFLGVLCVFDVNWRVLIHTVGAHQETVGLIEESSKYTNCSFQNCHFSHYKFFSITNKQKKSHWLSLVFWYKTRQGRFVRLVGKTKLYLPPP